MVRCFVTSTPIITLTTDFGLKEAYVGVMKGVLLAIEPRARLIDLVLAQEAAIEVEDEVFAKPSTSA